MTLPDNDAQFPALDMAALAALDSQIDGQILRGEERLTLAELSERTGWTPDELQQLWLWAGLPVLEDEDVYTIEDVEGLNGLRQYDQEQQFDKQAMSSLIRSIGSSVERMAVWQVENLVQHLIRSRGLGDTAARLEAARYAPAQADMIGFLVEKIWRRHYAAAIHRVTTEAVLRRGVSDDDKEFPLIITAGFINIVNFNEIVAGFTPTEYADYVQDFHDHVSDVVNAAGGRVIKHMGDFVLFGAARPDQGADLALKILEVAHEYSPADVQIGLVSCRVTTRYGDIYAPAINDALLLSREAPPGGLLVDQDTARMLARHPRFELESQPQIEIKSHNKVDAIKVTYAP